MNIGWVILIVVLLFTAAIIFELILGFENMKWLVACGFWIKCLRGIGSNFFILENVPFRSRLRPPDVLIIKVKIWYIVS